MKCADPFSIFSMTQFRRNECIGSIECECDECLFDQAVIRGRRMLSATKNASIPIQELAGPSMVLKLLLQLVNIALGVALLSGIVWLPWRLAQSDALLERLIVKSTDAFVITDSLISEVVGSSPPEVRSLDSPVGLRRVSP